MGRVELQTFLTANQRGWWCQGWCSERGGGCVCEINRPSDWPQIRRDFSLRQHHIWLAAVSEVTEKKG